MFAWGIVVWRLSEEFVHPAWSLVSFFNYAWLCTFLFRVDPRATVLALPLLIGRASSFVSFVFIEYGSAIPELGTVGTPGPYASSYFFYMLVTYGGYMAAFRLMAEPPGRLRLHPLTPLTDYYANWIAAAVVGFAGLVVLWLLARGAMTGFPLLAGTDRFVFRRHTDTVTLYMLNLKTVILFMLGMVAFSLPTWRFWRTSAILGATVLLAVYFLFGDKFFTQLGGLLSFLTPYLYIHYEKVRRHFLIFLALGSAALTVVFGFTWFIYSQGGAMTPAATMERISGRLVGQGELWYLQAKIGAPMVHWDAQFVERNIEALTVKEMNLYAVQQSLGPNYFSNRYAPDRIRNSILRNAGSSTYTAALEPLGLVMFGWGGLAVLLLAVGVLTALLKIYLAFAISSRSIISAVLVSYVSAQVGAGLTQGAPWTFLSVFALKWFSVILVIELGLYMFGRSQSNSRQRRNMKPHMARTPLNSSTPT